MNPGHGQRGYTLGGISGGEGGGGDGEDQKGYQQYARIKLQ